MPDRSPPSAARRLAIGVACALAVAGAAAPWVAGDGYAPLPPRVRASARAVVPGAALDARDLPPVLAARLAEGSRAEHAATRRGDPAPAAAVATAPTRVEIRDAAPPPPRLVAATPDQIPCDGALDCVHRDPDRYRREQRAALAHAGLESLLREQGIPAELATAFRAELDANLAALAAPAPAP